MAEIVTLKGLSDTIKICWDGLRWVGILVFCFRDQARARTPALQPVRRHGATFMRLRC